MNAPAAPAETILVVDDVRSNRDLATAVLEELGYAVRQAADGREALAQIEADEPDLILLDVAMPHMDGITLCRALKAHPGHRLVPVVLITAYGDRDTRLAGIEAGADDFLTKPFDARELVLRAKVLLRERRLNKRLDGAENVILTLARIVEARDLYTVHHAERVGLMARELGTLDGLADEDRTRLYRGGVLHDVGKIALPLEILAKRGPLTDDERVIVQGHAAEGERICGPLRSVREYLEIVRHHHERWDGHGYPDHLAGVEIPRHARMVAVADAWDAMTSDRPYRPALPRDEALRRLTDGAGHQWDPGAVEMFMRLLEAGQVDAIARQQLS